MLEKTTIPVPPYAALACIYNEVMRHVDYVEWADYVDRVFHRSGMKRKHILEIACGAGKVGVLLRKQGYEVVGCDLSLEMLREARRHTLTEGVSVPLFATDIRILSTREYFEGGLCLYDSINYLLDIEEVKMALENTYRCLLPSGVFIFDICTRLNSKQYFEKYTDRVKGDGYRFIRKSRFDNETSLQYNSFTIYLKGCKEPFLEEHIQRIYSVDDILDAVASSSFHLLGCFEDTTFKQGSERSERVHLVLIK